MRADIPTLQEMMQRCDSYETADAEPTLGLQI